MYLALLMWRWGVFGCVHCSGVVGLELGWYWVTVQQLLNGPPWAVPGGSFQLLLAKYICKLILTQQFSDFNRKIWLNVPVQLGGMSRFVFGRRDLGPIGKVVIQVQLFTIVSTWKWLFCLFHSLSLRSQESSSSACHAFGFGCRASISKDQIDGHMYFDML